MYAEECHGLTSVVPDAIGAYVDVECRAKAPSCMSRDNGLFVPLRLTSESTLKHIRTDSGRARGNHADLPGSVQLRSRDHLFFTTDFAGAEAESAEGLTAKRFHKEVRIIPHLGARRCIRQCGKTVNSVTDFSEIFK